MKIIGLTGSFKTGKTTSARIFKRLGAKVIDADSFARSTLKPKTKTYKKLIKVFGKSILDKSAKINRQKLAGCVFSCKKNLKKINAIIHPQVIKDIKKEIAKIKKVDPESVVVVDAPLLFEAKIQAMMDKIIVVAAPRKKQLKRAKKQTSLTDKEIAQRIKSQMPLKKKIKLADAVIDNSKDLRKTEKQVKLIWKKIKE